MSNVINKGLDMDQDSRDFSLDCLNANGYSFIGRYYGTGKLQPLELNEARAITAAGLDIVAIWQTTGDDVSYFSQDKGESDGHDACLYAHEHIGQPLDSPIYFAVDYDATEEDVETAIKRYFQGVQAGFSQVISAGNVYPIGVYGSGMVCSRLTAAGLVTYTWLSESPRFNGTAEYEDWNIKQYVLEDTVCGLDSLAADGDITKGDGGGFQIG